MFPYEKSLVAEVRAIDDTHCALAYDPDRRQWPWLALPCWHPVVAEKYSYFSSVTAGLATGLLSETSFTALTAMDWQFHGEFLTGRYPLTGEMESLTADRQARFTLRAKDGAGEPVYHMQGRGVVFRSRDFEAWRAQLKSSAMGRDVDPSAFVAAPATLAACSMQEAVLIAAPVDDSTCTARVSEITGFHPGHPYHTGSRDHANAAHLLDAAYQAAHALLARRGTWKAGNSPLCCSGGRARFRSYVELDRNFDLTLTQCAPPPGEAENTVETRFDVQQDGRPCARLTLHLHAGS